MNELQRSCIFAHESGHQKGPQFGVIRGVTMRQGKARIEYEIKNLDKFLTATDLDDLAFALDISKWEMNRTHWAVTVKT